jgi:hypothetical protein
VDKISCLAFILYQSSKSQDIKKLAIDLLNGDVSLHELKMDIRSKSQMMEAELVLKKNELDRNKVQEFVENFMLIEV